MVLGQLIAGMNTARIRNLAAAGLFVFLNLGLLHNLAAWRWTSQLAKDTLEDVTRLAPLPASKRNLSSRICRIRSVVYSSSGWG